MLHDGNKIFGDAYSEESIRLIRDHLQESHEDKDDESLAVRFCRLLQRVQDQELSHQATWNSYLKAVQRNAQKDSE